MASVAQWLQGTRPRTLPVSVAPVLAGAATAWRHVPQASFWTPTRILVVLLAGLVALALQVGVNFANDYSDGIRGTDANRVGPQRLVGSGATTPGRVRAAAFGCFGLAAIAGLVIVLLSGMWWLLGVGVAAILAAWYYTGGRRPYGYAGLGEVFVFVFFGLVATCGTHLVLTGGIDLASVLAATAIGALACAVLVANNLRDIPTDLANDKRTLAVIMGDRGSRIFYHALVVLALVLVLVIAAVAGWWLLLGLLALPLAVAGMRTVGSGSTGMALVPVLRTTGQAELVLAVGLLVGAGLSLL